MMNDLLEEILLFVLFVFGVFCLLAIILVPVLLFERASCGNLEEVTGHSTEWRIAGGCFVDDGSGMKTRDAYELSFAAERGLSND